jgi:hypothetical protein
LSAAVEAMESRAYLSGGGVVFGTPVNTGTASLGISPVYVNLDQIYGTNHADLISANANNSLSILPGSGNGMFGAATPSNTINLTFTPLTIRTAKLSSANNQIDIVVGSTSNNTVGVVLQDDSHQFHEFDYMAQLGEAGLTNTQSVAIGDFNGDGQMDFAVASNDNGTSNNVAIFLNDGSGGFTLHQILSVPHSQIASITAFKAGTREDLAVADATSNAVTVLTNDGSGHFVSGQDYAVGADPVTIVDGTFNLNRDTNDDLVTANAQGGSVSVLIGNGDGSFQTNAVTTSLGTAVGSGGGPLKVRVSNLNSDGLPDLICLLTPGSSGDAAVLLGNGDGTFHVGNVVGNGQGNYNAAAAGDLDGDGLTDMVLASNSAPNAQVTSLLNSTNKDTTPPTASVDITQPTLTAGSATIPFTVTYSDQFQVDASTVNSGNITVTGPNGNTLPVTLMSTNLANGQKVTVTYSIQAQNGALSSADNGQYTVTTTSDTAAAVKNANGVPTAGGPIGTFNVTAPSANPNGPNLVAGAVNVRNPATAVAGTRFAGATNVVVVNSGNQAAKGSIVIQLYALPSASIPGGTTPLESVTRRINLRAGGRTVLSLPGFKWPADLTGSQFIVANVNATQTINESNFGDNVGISAKSTNVALPFVDIDNLWSGKLPATLKPGRRAALAVMLKNLGNVPARGVATFTIQAVDANNVSTTIGTGNVRIAAAALGRQAVMLPVTVPTTLSSGAYHLMVTISLPGDTNAGNDTATSTSTLTV